MFMIPSETTNCPPETSVVDCVRAKLKTYLQGHDLGQWITDRAPKNFEPFYSSIDIRDASFKLAPVDANLYPAGFNNVCEDDVEQSPEILKKLLISHLGVLPKKMAILPEAHTKNRYYADNLRALKGLFTQMGIQCEIGWFADPLPQGPGEKPVELATTDGEPLKAFPFHRQGDTLLFEPFEPEFILLNNDFSSGYPRCLEGIKQRVEPSPRLGWHTRKKSDFFHHYNELITQFCGEVGIDPWTLRVETRLVTGVDFDQNQGMAEIAKVVDEVLADMQGNYEKRGIAEKPFVFVKSNSGTYGMGILKVESGKELLELNRRERNKMAVVKNKLQVHDVIVQEGIPTRFQRDGVYAEPAIYLLGPELLGGFLRTNPNKGRIDNLNSQGMVFEKLCMSDLRNGADRDLELELVYGTIAKICVAAMALETSKIDSLSSVQYKSLLERNSI
jgi:glutamate--cysteine ligase